MIRNFRPQSLAILIGAFIMGNLCSQSQLSKIDSLSDLLKTDSPDTNKVNHLCEIGKELMYQDPDTAILLGNQALSIATIIISSSNKEIQQAAKKGLFKSNNLLGSCYYLKSDYPVSITYYHTALDIAKAMNNKTATATSYNNIGLIYKSQGNFPKALEYFFNALSINTELNDKKNIALNLGNIGLVYNNQGDFKNALDYYFKALKLNEELKNKKNMALNIGNIANVYTEQGDYKNALEYFLKNLAINEELENTNGIATVLGNIGSVYRSMKEYEKANEYFLKALALSKEIDDKSGVAINLGNLGSICLNEKKYSEAEHYLLQALQLSEEIDQLDLIKEHNQYLSELYSQTNRYQLAFEHYVAYTNAKDSLFNDDKSKEIGRLEMQHEIEIEELERKKQEELANQLEIQTRERRHLLQYSGIGIGLLFIGVLVIMLGFVKISPLLARSVTFLSILLFFEFILVVMDPYIDQYSGGEPLYKLLINALVALGIFPLNAILEKTISKRLVNRS